MYPEDSSSGFTVPIGRGRGGLGQAEPNCPQPVSTAERDRLRDELNRFTGNWMGQKPHGIHWHEGHPDIKRAIEDIIMRMIGITQRPKKLRCSAEMRKRAREWTSSLHSLLVKVKSGKGTYGGFTTVPQTFKWGFYRGPTYTIRAWPIPSAAAARAPVVSSAPPGSIVVGGKAFPTSKAAREALATTPAGPAAAVPAAPPPAGGPTPSPVAGLPAELGGIPTNYLLYGGLVVAALMFLKK